MSLLPPRAIGGGRFHNLITSPPRRRGSRANVEAPGLWIPAFAGMTDNRLIFGDSFTVSLSTFHDFTQLLYAAEVVPESWRKTKYELIASRVLPETPSRIAEARNTSSTVSSGTLPTNNNSPVMPIDPKAGGWPEPRRRPAPRASPRRFADGRGRRGRNRSMQ